MMIMVYVDDVPHLRMDDYPGELRIWTQDGWYVYDELDRVLPFEEEEDDEDEGVAYGFIIRRQRATPNEHMFQFYVREQSRERTPLALSKYTIQVSPDDEDETLAHIRVLGSDGNSVFGFWVTDWVETPRLGVSQPEPSEPTGPPRFDREEIL
jgi:hypothetical protein